MTTEQDQELSTIAMDEHKFRVQVLVGQTEIKGQLEKGSLRMDTIEKTLEDVKDSHGKRISKLEKETGLAKGISGIAGVITGVLGQLGFNFIRGRQ